MRMDFKNFKKIREDKISATLKHPDGHEINVAKSGISPRMRAQLSSLPLNMADQGMVEDPNQVSSQPDQVASQPQQPVVVNVNNAPPQNSMDYMAPVVSGGASVQPPPQAAPGKEYFSNGTFDERKFAVLNPDVDPEKRLNAFQEMKSQQEAAATNQAEAMKKKAEAAAKFNQVASQYGLPMSPGAQMPEAQAQVPATANAAMTEGQQAPQAPQNADPYGYNAAANMTVSGVGEQIQGLNDAAAATAQAEQAKARAYDLNIKSQEQALNIYKNQLGMLQKQNQSFIQAVQQNHIDPNRYINSMSTGEKIWSGIGALLGGAGAGITRTENPALQYLNAQIERDIKTQEHEGENARTLLNANLAQFKNVYDATAMTRIQLQDILASQIQSAAAKSGTPLAMANAKMAIGKLMEEKAQTIQAVAARQAMMQGLQTGGQGNPALAIKMMMDPKDQPKAFEELGELQERFKAKQNATKLMREYYDLNTLGGNVNPQSRVRMSQIKAQIPMELARMISGKVSDAEVEQTTNLLPSLLANEQTFLKGLRSVEDIFNQKLNAPTIQSNPMVYGMVQKMMVAPTERYNSQGQDKFQLGAPVLAGGR